MTTGGTEYESPASARLGPAETSIALLVAILGLTGFSQGINNAAAALYGNEFGLGAPALASAFGWMSIGAFGTLLLNRWMDRAGRRLALLVCFIGTSLSALGIALSPTFGLFLFAQIGQMMFNGALMMAAVVIISEQLPEAERARGQALGGFVGQVASGAAMIGVALVTTLPGTWRWVWAFTGAPLILLPLVARFARESARFTADQDKPTSGSSSAELFAPRYRARTIASVVSSFGVNVTAFATMTWVLYHPQTALGIAPGWATAIVIVGGAIGLAGFGAGAMTANRIGRREALMLSRLGFAGFGIAYYWIPASASPQVEIALTLVFAAMSFCFGASVTAGRIVITELFPTRLRGTISGLSMAVGTAAATFAHFAVAFLSAATGDQVLAISLIALTGIPTAVFMYVMVPETAHLTLDEASLEHDSAE